MAEEDEYRSFRVIGRSLEHLAKKMNDLKSDDLVKIGNGMIIKDLDANAESCKNLAKRFFEEKERNVFQYNMGIVCNSLITYKKDLEASKKALFDKLVGTQQDVVGIELKFLDQELKVVDYYVQRYCKKSD